MMMGKGQGCWLRQFRPVDNSGTTALVLVHGQVNINVGGGVDEFTEEVKKPIQMNT
jgi:hypothetical protein